MIIHGFTLHTKQQQQQNNQQLNLMKSTDFRDLQLLEVPE